MHFIQASKRCKQPGRVIYALNAKTPFAIATKWHQPIGTDQPLYLRQKKAGLN
jgi:hypothetical protein